MYSCKKLLLYILSIMLIIPLIHSMCNPGYKACMGKCVELFGDSGSFPDKNMHIIC